MVNIFDFDLQLMVWSKVPTVVEFYKEKHPIGQSGFRKAFIATSKHPEFQKKWVIKRYWRVCSSGGIQ